MPDEVVSIMNRKSGKVLTQSVNGEILAVSFDPMNPAHRWLRVSAGHGFYAYKNVMTGNALDHWYAGKGRGNVVAKNGDCEHINHQWYERDVEDIFIALQNRKSHCMLDHYFSDDIRVAPDDDPAYHERQWCLIYHREATEEVIRTVVLKNVRSGNVLTHADKVDAVDDHLELGTNQWSRIPVGSYFVYQNVASAMVLSHTEAGIGAYNDDKSDKRSHWFECILSKGYVAFKNRHSGHVLDHFFESSIRATDQKIGCLNDLWQIVYDLPSNWRPAAPANSPSTWIIRPDQVMLTAIIGEGSFGKVYHGKWSGCDVVVKMINFARSPPPPKEMESFLKEVKLWAELRHPNIVPFFGANLDQPPFFIVSEYAANGTLDHYLARGNNRDTLVWRKMLDVAKGLNRLHEREVIHGDLRSDNIVVSANGNAMLTDFGLSYLANATSVTMMRMKDHLGAMQWRAPEFAWDTTTRPLYESDIFSLGMCILEALTGGRPWGQNYDSNYVRILYRELRPGSNQVQQDLPVQRPEMVTDAQWKLIQWMISVNPQARPSMEQVLDELTTFANDEEFGELEQRNSSH